MGALAYFGDGLRNLVANLGTDRDKAAGSGYGPSMVGEQQLYYAYRGAWLPRKIVDVPALDACRNWRNWNAESVEISDIEAEETRLGVSVKVLSALKKARLFGGAAIYIATGDSKPEEALDPSRIGKGGVKQLVVLSRRVLTAGDLERDPESPQYGKPKNYTITSQGGQVTVHPSRVVVFVGVENPDPEMATGKDYGWGDSVLQSAYDAVRNADSTSANIASLVFEAKIDVIGIPGLSELLCTPDGEKQLTDRLRLSMTMKGINGALIKDSEESYDQKSAQFAGLTDILMSFMQLVSGAADIPMTRLLGQTPGGLNSTGEGDIRNYYDRIRAMQELEMTPAMAVLDECLIRSALGDRPDDVFYTWRSLWQSTDKEKADIGKLTAETIEIIDKTGLIPDDVMSKVAQNMLTEAGVAPGLESEMKDYVAPEDEGEDADNLASLNADPAGEVIADAAPRSLYVRRDVTNVAEIKAWADSQGIPELADDLHVTLVYSRQPLDWIKAGNAKEWAEKGRDELVIAEGGPRAVEPLGGMSAVLLFASSQLAWRHDEIIRAGASHDFPDYTIHISLTKSPVDLSDVEPYRGRIVLGPEIFEEIED